MNDNGELPEEFDRKREADVLEKLRTELKEINEQIATDIAIVKKQ